VVGPEIEDWQRAAEVGAARRHDVSGHAHALPRWTPAQASISSALVQQMIDWARSGLPNEACGLLAADQSAEEGGVPLRFIPMRNAAASPYRYLVDPEEQLHVMLAIDDRGEVVWGIFHSHVASKPEPSATDVGLAAYPDALYLICSLESAVPVIRAWAIEDGRVGEVVLQVI
jgi:[CysO sulfur-carrier protein]-S-L-cysteine hydrolase